MAVGRLRPSEILRLSALALGIASLFGGGVAAAVAPGVTLPGGVVLSTVAIAGGLAGILLLVAALLPRPGELRGLIVRATPELAPYASPLTNLGVFVLVVVSTTAVYQGCIDVFAGAHAGGVGTGVPDPGRLQALIVAGTILFWVLVLVFAWVLRDTLRLGRWADRPVGPSEPGPTVPSPPDRWISAAMSDGSPPEPPRGRGWVLAVTAAATGLVAAFAIELLEIGTDPISAGLWIASQAAVPVYAVGLARAFESWDRVVRGAEQRFFDRVRPLPAGTTPAAVGGRFVH